MLVFLRMGKTLGYKLRIRANEEIRLKNPDQVRMTDEPHSAMKMGREEWNPELQEGM